MRTVTLEVSSREEVSRRFLSAFEGQPQGEFISFETPALLFKVLTQKRWELLSVMTGAGPMTLREVARRAGRDVKAVHGDVHALLNVGILQKTEDGRIVFPFDAVRVNFVLQAA
jgi:predicted transcriptional regulator